MTSSQTGRQVISYSPPCELVTSVWGIYLRQATEMEVNQLVEVRPGRADLNWETILGTNLKVRCRRTSRRIAENTEGVPFVGAASHFIEWSDWSLSLTTTEEGSDFTHWESPDSPFPTKTPKALFRKISQEKLSKWRIGPYWTNCNGDEQIWERRMWGSSTFKRPLTYGWWWPRDENDEKTGRHLLISYALAAYQAGAERRQRNKIVTFFITFANNEAGQHWQVIYAHIQGRVRAHWQRGKSGDLVQL